MKELFPGYYRPTDAEFKALWAECFFVFDANLLLNLYRYSAETRRSLLSILTGIQSRCWIAYQAALEFHENRLQVIEEQVASYKRFHNPLSEFEAALANKRTHPFIASETLDALKKAVLNVQQELERRRQEYEQLLSADSLLDEITGIFAGRTGGKFTDQLESDIRKSGEARYKSKIPPGYKDEAKGDPRKFGDLLLWFQIIEEAKTRKKPVILVTDDSKEDWWWVVSGRTVGPRPELVEEMKREAQVQFYMYEPDRFMAYAETHLKQEVDHDAIQEVKDVAEMQAQERRVEKEIVEEVKRQVPPQEVSATLESHSGSIRDLAKAISDQQAIYKSIATPSPAFQEIARQAAEIGKLGSLFSPPPAFVEMSRMMAEQQAAISKITAPIAASMDAYRKITEQMTAPYRAMSEAVRQINEQQAVFRSVVAPFESIKEATRMASKHSNLGSGFPFAGLSGAKPVEAGTESALDGDGERANEQTEAATRTASSTEQPTDDPLVDGEAGA